MASTLTSLTGKLGWARQEGVRASVDNAGRRQFAFAQEKDVHAERLWMGITKATGALGNTSCLVGTAEQVADANLLMVLMMVVPTLAITFLAVLGGIWIAKSF